MNNLFAKAITSSIQANKDKIEKLTKQNLNLKNKNKKLKQQLEAYENMRKEIIKIINREKNDDGDLYLDEFEVSDLLNILNKVGGSDE